MTTDRYVGVCSIPASFLLIALIILHWNRPWKTLPDLENSLVDKTTTVKVNKKKLHKKEVSKEFFDLTSRNLCE